MATAIPNGTPSTSTAAAPGSPTSSSNARNRRASKRIEKIKHKQENVKESKEVPKPTYCVCKGPEDGRPMILCEICEDWFHFECVNVNEREAEEIKFFVCPPCSEKTGFLSIMEWEGPNVVAPVEPIPDTNATPRTKKQKVKKVAEALPEKQVIDWTSAEESAESGDEYVEDATKMNGKGKGRKKARVASSSPSSSDDEKENLKTPSGVGTKRKHPPASSHPVSNKKQKTRPLQTPLTVEEDPMRRYCLTKLRGILEPIFLRMRPFDGGGGKAEKEGAEGGVNKEEVEDDEAEAAHRNRVVAAATKYASELEEALFEGYGEPDKTGRKAAGGKYKERFRTISFNVDKPSRHSLHKLISSAPAAISPQQLSQMTSAELADESTKLDILHAQEESLHMSILVDEGKKVPVAKRTHKGEEAIESFGFGGVGGAGGEGDGGEERRERERMMRLRTNTEGSPVESPTRPNFTHSGMGSQLQLQSPTRPLFVVPPAAETFSPTTMTPTAEPSVDMADDVEVELPDSPPAEEPFQDRDQDLMELVDPEPSLGQPPPPPTTTAVTSPPHRGSIPAPIMGPQRQTSFDLSSLWSMSKSSQSIVMMRDPNAEDMEVGTPEEEERDARGRGKVEVSMPVAAPADDGDFDMLLEDDGTTPHLDEFQPGRPLAEIQQETYEGLPIVWTGTVNMPYDSSITYSPLVTAKQIAGRPLGVDVDLWKVLFPSINPTVDGRVPTDQSAKYLVQSRMSASKELVAVAFAPANENHREQYNQMFDFLIGKNRHGLIFPWGKHHNHKTEPPGRELYIVPVVPSSALPEYIDLMDQLKLPQQRIEKVLIGIWVLTKGKLVKASPAPAPVPAPPAMASTPATAALPTALTAALAIAGPQIDIAALKEEVATLTPEQLEIVARALSHSQTGAGLGLASLVPSVAPAPTNTPVPAVVAPGHASPPGTGPVPGMFPPSFPPFPPTGVPSVTSPHIPPPPPSMAHPNLNPNPNSPATIPGPAPITGGMSPAHVPPTPASPPRGPPPPLGYPNERPRGHGRRGGASGGPYRDGSREFVPNDRSQDRWRDGWDGRGGAAGPSGREADAWPRDSGWRGRGRGRGRGFSDGSPRGNSEQRWN